MRRKTVNCPVCYNRTSIYAIQFPCWHCQALLESPSHAQGQPAVCPKCERDLSVPHDVIYLPCMERLDHLTNCFAFFCPNCEREAIAEKKNVGLYGVCPYCLIVMEVPNWGHEAKPEPPRPSADPLASLKESATIRCTSCGSHIPARSRLCWQCGAEVDPEALHRDRDV